MMITTRSKICEITLSMPEQCWYNSFQSYHIHLLKTKQHCQLYIPCSNSQRKNKLNLRNREKPRTQLKFKLTWKTNLNSCLEPCLKMQKQKVRQRGLAWTLKATPVSTAVADPKIQTERDTIEIWTKMLNILTYTTDTLTH